MGLYQALTELEYPESDGRPMGETDLHRKWMIRILQIMEQRYRDQQVYIASDLLLYYTEGLPYQYVVPDVFVVKDSQLGNRRTYKVWEEGQAPHVVFEVTSRGTRREDEVHKPGVYSQIGVRELFLYDPTADYLTPPLQGFNLQGVAKPVRIEPDSSGRIRSAELDIDLCLDGYNLVITDASSGEIQVTQAEAAIAAHEAEQQAREKEVKARKEEAKAREEETKARKAAEEENTALREEIERLRRQIGNDEEAGD